MRPIWIKRLSLDLGCPHFSCHPDGTPIKRTNIQCIVLHYTAGSCESTLNWFMDKASRVSAHLVVDRDGTIYEVLAPEFIAWHAGVSNWRGM